MRAPLSWCATTSTCRPTRMRARRRPLVHAGLEVEKVETPGHDVVWAHRRRPGPRLRRGDPQQRRTIRWCQVEVGPADDDVRGIVCGARNFSVGDLVVVALPRRRASGRVRDLGSRKTYGHVSDGMICSARELGLGDDHTGIIVLPPSMPPPPLGSDAIDLLVLRDGVFDISVTPDRGYCLSMRGIAARRPPRTACRCATRPTSSRARPRRAVIRSSSTTRSDAIGSSRARSLGSTRRRRRRCGCVGACSLRACARSRSSSTSRTTSCSRPGSRSTRTTGHCSPARCARDERPPVRRCRPSTVSPATSTPTTCSSRTIPVRSGSPA